MDTTKKEGYRLFLDDVREPKDCLAYMHLRIGAKNPIYLEDWMIAKCYQDFIDIINEMGIPEFVSYDHDLADEHYIYDMSGNYKERTGYDCAKWLIEYCKSKGVQHPEYAVHSMNPIGTENIKRLLR